MTTTSRGLGWEHRRERARLLPLAYGTPCAYCGRVMQPCPIAHDPRKPCRECLELDHTIPRALGGTTGQGRITHALCNRAAGGRLAAALRRTRQRRSRW